MRHNSKNTTFSSGTPIVEQSKQLLRRFFAVCFENKLDVTISRRMAGGLAIILTFLATTSATLDAAIPLRGFRNDLSQNNDTFVPLDLNGDKKTDLLYYRAGSGDTQGYAGAYLSRGDGTFRHVPYREPGNSFNGFSGDAADSRDRAEPLDLNGDGRDDFLWYRPGTGYASVCYSKGDGSLDCEDLLNPNGRVKGFTGDVMDERDRAIPLDINGDGRADFLWIRPGAGFANLYISKADGTLQNIIYSRPGVPSNGFRDSVMGGRERVLPLDLNGDGKSDFFWYTPGSGWAHMYLSRGDGTLQALPYSSPDARSYGFLGNVNDTRDTAVALDLNGDLKDDILWYRPGAGWATAYLSNGDGSVRAVEYSQPGKQLNGFLGNVDDERDRALPLDMNGDGKDDFLWYRPGSGFAGVYLSNGDGKLDYVGFSTPEGRSNGFLGDVADTRDAAAAVRLTEGTRWGFIWYRPGGGAFEAYAADSSKPGVQLTRTPFLGRPQYWMEDMAYVIRNTPMKGVVMPGTHDSAMYSGMADSDLAKNHRLDFYGQMAAGARWFDFRFAFIRYASPGLGRFPDDSIVYSAAGNPMQTGLYMTGHGKYMVNVSLAQAVQQIKTFLDEHPREIVLLHTSSALAGAGGDQREEATTVLRRGFGSLIYDTDAAYSACLILGSACKPAGPAHRLYPQDVTPELLWSLNKRVILLDDSNSFTGFGDDIAWPTSWSQIYAGYKSAEDGIANIEGQLKYMWKDLQQYRKAFTPAAQATKMIALNGALTPYGETPCYDMCGFGPIPLSRAFNPKLAEVLRSHRWRAHALNIISLDNIGEGDIADVIISLNNQYWSNQQRSDVSDIAAGPDGTVWMVQQNGDIYRRLNGSTSWTRLAGAAVRIATDPKGVPWVLSSQGNIFRYSATGEWELMPGLARDIGIGGDGSVWVLGSRQIDAAGYEIYRWTGSGWTQAPGAAVRISVDPGGRAWVVSGVGEIYRYNPNSPTSWDRIPNAKTVDDSVSGIVGVVAHPLDLGVGGDGSVWLAAGGSLWRFNGAGWDAFPMDASALAVGHDGRPWVIREAGNVLYHGAAY